MSSKADLKILISVTNEAKGIIDGLMKDLGSLSQTLKKVGDVAVGDKAAKSLGDVGRASKEANKGLGEVSDTSKKTEVSLSGLGTALKFVAGGFLALKSVGILRDLADSAARTETLGVVLKVVARNAGITATAVDEADRSVQKLGITARASRQSLSQFIQAGLDIGKAAELAKVAQNSAVIAGEDSSQTFGRLITNIQQMDVMGLRFVGITISSDEAYANYGKTIGKTGDALTQAERKQAFLNEVLLKGGDIAGVYEASMNTVGKQLTSLPRLHEGLAVSIGSLLLPAYSAMVKEFSEFLKYAGATADTLDESSTGAENFGKAVGSIAKDVRLAVQALMDLKQVLITVAELWAFVKIIGWARALGLATAATISFTRAGFLMGTMVRGVVAIFGGLPGLVIAASIALYNLAQSEGKVGAAARIAMNAIMLLMQVALLPFRQIVVGLGVAWDTLVGVLKGKSLGKAVSDAANEGRRQLTALSGEVSATYARIGKATDEFNNKKTTAGVDPANVDAVTGAIQRSLTTMDALKAKWGEAAKAGNDSLKEQIEGQIKKARVDEQALLTALETLKASKNLTDADKEKIKATEEAIAAKGKEAAALKKAQEAYAEARKNLKLDAFKIDGKTVVSADAASAISGFGTITKEVMLGVKNKTLDAATAATTLRVAFEQMVGSAKTKDELEAIRVAMASIAKEGGAATAAALATAAKSTQVDDDAARRLRDEERAKYKARVADAREFRQAQFEVAQAGVKAATDLELSVLRGGLEKQEEIYKNGKLSIEEYYAAKRKEVARTAEVEAEALRAQERNLTAQINDKAGKSAAELKNLERERIAVRSQLNLTLEEARQKEAALNAEMRDSIQAQQRLYAAAKAGYQELVGQTAAARKAANAQEFGDKTKEIVPDNSSDEDEKALDNLRKTRDIKDQIVDLDEKDKVLRVESAGLSKAETDINREFELGLLTRTEYEVRMRGIVAGRIALAEKELALLIERAKIADTPENQEKILQKEREITDLRTRAYTQLRKTADDINKAFENASNNFLNSLMDGTKTWKEAFTSALRGLALELGKLATSKISESLFGKGGQIDVGGAVLGKDGSGDGGITGFFSSLFGGSKDSKGSSTSRGNSVSTPVYVQEVSAGGKAGTALGISGAASDGTGTGGTGTGMFQGMFSGISSMLSTLLASLKAGLTSLVSGIGSLFGGGGGQNWIGSLATMFGFADGGYVSGPGTGTSDSIRARLSNGEFVVKQTQTAKWLPLLAAINEGMLDNFSPMVRRPRSARFADGGLVDLPAGGATNVTANTKVVNMFDLDSALSEYLNTRGGERAILNVIQRNPGAARG